MFFFREDLNFICKVHKRKNLVFMKAMPRGNLRDTSSVKEMNYLIWMTQTC